MTVQPRGIVVGNAAAFTASILFGAAVVATRVAVRDVPPLGLAVLRFGQGGLILLAVLAATDRSLLRVAGRDLRAIAALGALLFALFPAAFNKALDLTTASRGAVMLATMPLWSAILGRWGRREALSPRQLAGVGLSVVGVGAVFLESGGGIGGDSRVMAGNALMLFTAFCGGLYGVLAKPLLGRYPAITVTGYMMAAGTALLLPLGVAEGLGGALRDVDRDVVGLVVFLGVPAGALGYWLIAFALARLSPTQAIVYINVNPMSATVLGALFLDESITAGFVAGFALVAVGLVLANWPAPMRPTRPARTGDQGTPVRRHSSTSSE